MIQLILFYQSHDAQKYAQTHAYTVALCTIFCFITSKNYSGQCTMHATCHYLCFSCLCFMLLRIHINMFFRHTSIKLEIVKHGTVNIYGSQLDALYMYIHGIRSRPMRGAPFRTGSIAPCDPSLIYVSGWIFLLRNPFLSLTFADKFSLPQIHCFILKLQQENAP